MREFEMSCKETILMARTMFVWQNLLKKNQVIEQSLLIANKKQNSHPPTWLWIQKVVSETGKFIPRPKCQPFSCFLQKMKIKSLEAENEKLRRQLGKNTLKSMVFLKSPPPPDFKLMLWCVQAVTAKGRPKLEKQERKILLSGYKQCYTFKYMNSALITCNKLNPRG